jgi:hypothetical protein
MKVLDDDAICEYSSHDDCVFDIDYTHLVTPGTHVISNGSDETREEIVHVRLGGLSRFGSVHKVQKERKKKTRQLCMLTGRMPLL